VGGNYGTKAVPTYVMAEAETAPLPKITIEEPPPPPPPPPRRSLAARLGDLPMRIIYRVVIATVATLAVATAAVVFLVTGDHKGTPTAAAPGGTAPRASQPAAGQASSAPPASSGVAVPSASDRASASPSPGSPASAGPSQTAAGQSEVLAQGTASPVPTPTPGSSALLAAQADPRVPPLPGDRKLTDYRGHGAATKGRVKDKRSGIGFARFTKSWKLVRSSPFATRRTLPAAKGGKQRGLLATCPVPIVVQDDIKDTALLAARWTLNYHPEGATISWTASQPLKAGKRKGWVLGYRVQYKVGGKKHVSTAAVALLDVPRAKPALLFVTIPDGQKKRWADINTVISSLRPL
jgi:hypothetical protein